MQLRDVHSHIARVEAQVVVIGNGSARQAAAVRDEMALPFVLLVDPSRRSYRLAGLRRGRSRVLDPRLLRATWRAWRSGARQTALQGDPWQLGGLLLFDGSGRILARQRSAYPGDHWPPSRILATLEAAMGSPSS